MTVTQQTRPFRAILQTLLAGIGQIYFQPSKLTGAMLLLALYMARPSLAAGCLLGVSVATLTATVTRLQQAQISDGLYGYNAALTGIGLCALYQPNAALVGWIVIASIATVFGTHLFLRWGKLPALTLQFVLVMLLAASFGPTLGLPPQASGAGCSDAPLAYHFCLMGQITFIASAPLGMLVLAALTRYRWHQGAWAIVGGLMAWSALFTGTVLWPQGDIGTQAVGIGLNCVLVALGLTVNRRSWPLRLLGVAATIPLCLALGALGLPYFTLPFVLATWAVLLISRPLARQPSDAAIGQPSSGYSLHCIRNNPPASTPIAAGAGIEK